MIKWDEERGIRNVKNKSDKRVKQKYSEWKKKEGINRGLIENRKNWKEERYE